MDNDGNGLPDTWEWEHFGFVGVNPDGDDDADGTTNWMEYLSGTGPTDPRSVFRPRPGSQGDDFVLRWNTVSGRSYRIWGSSDLNSWEALHTMHGDGAPIEFTYGPAASGESSYFFEIEIFLP